jgi:hypothetical protein
MTGANTSHSVQATVRFASQTEWRTNWSFFSLGIARIDAASAWIPSKLFERIGTRVFLSRKFYELSIVAPVRPAAPKPAGAATSRRATADQRSQRASAYLCLP